MTSIRGSGKFARVEEGRSRRVSWWWLRMKRDPYEEGIYIHPMDPMDRKCSSIIAKALPIFFVFLGKSFRRNIQIHIEECLIRVGCYREYKWSIVVIIMVSRQYVCTMFRKYLESDVSMTSVFCAIRSVRTIDMTPQEERAVTPGDWLVGIDIDTATETQRWRTTKRLTCQPLRYHAVSTVRILRNFRNKDNHQSLS